MSRKIKSTAALESKSNDDDTSSSSESEPEVMFAPAEPPARVASVEATSTTILDMEFSSDSESSDFEPPSDATVISAEGGIAFNSLVEQTVLSMDFGSDGSLADSNSDVDSDFTASDKTVSDPELSDEPSSSEAEGAEDDMIAVVPEGQFNNLFQRFGKEALGPTHKLARQRKVMARVAAQRGRTRKHKMDKSCKKTAQQRATEFASDGMVVQAGVLWCSFCNTQVRRQCCAIKAHCRSKMHIRNSDRVARDVARDAAIRDILDFATLAGTLPLPAPF